MESTGGVARAPRDSLRRITGGKPSSSSRIAKPPKGIINPSRVGKETHQVSASSSKRRKKTKRLGAVHPSVRLAEDWTIRAEQVEELRAKELLYSWEGSSLVHHNPCCTGLSRGPAQRSTAWSFRVDPAKSEIARGSLPPAMERRLSRRPWEWSTKDCEDVLADVIGAYLPSAIEHVNLALPNPDRDPVDVDQRHPAAEAADPAETAETEDCTSAIHPTQAPTGGGSPSSSTTGGGMVVMPSENGHVGSREDSRQHAAGSKSAEHVQPLGNRRLTCGDEANVDVRRGAASELRRDHDSRTRKRMGSTAEPERELPGGELRCQRRRLSALSEVQTTVTSDAILKEDERKARELTAELNRNHPRRRRVSGGETSEPVENSRTLPPRGDERVKATNPVDLGSRTGYAAHPAKEDARRRQQGSGENEDDDGDDDEDDDEEHGTWPLVVGASAEVWWDDAWYRCTMSSVSTSDQRGVLEFLPYRRKGRAWGREYSTELDLGDWMRAGHLARPGTHLQWD